MLKSILRMKRQFGSQGLPNMRGPENGPVSVYLAALPWSQLLQTATSFLQIYLVYFEIFWALVDCG